MIHLILDNVQQTLVRFMDFFYYLDGSTLHLDYSLAFLSLLYISLYFWGTHRNQRLVYQWIKNDFYPFLIKQFYQLGDGQHHILQYSATEYILYATGRKNCQQFALFFNLLPRQALFSLPFKYLKGPDQLEFHITLNVTSAPSDFQISILKSKYSPCPSFMTAPKVPNSYLPSTHEVHTRHPKLVPYLLASDPRVHRFLTHPTILPHLHVFAWTHTSLFLYCDAKIGSLVLPFLCWSIDYVYDLQTRKEVRHWLNKRKSF
ncbi:hypothetical protein HMI54_015253 [Coelomomyces lativittatus]|nr:hypothetical protein HMI54_015253 [Coelomomyces lativittatus]KAJ1514739.1 hypothetical protein HMI55_004410 [Coelomomyces lativittatus]KAJ1515851.1 hypothetical protein HMI56_000021 [Coelomomyces lativittatus]